MLFRSYMLKGIGTSKIKDNFLFENKKFSLMKYKIDDMPKSGWDFSTKYIYPIITGPHIEPFKYDTHDEFCILPYDKNNTSAPIPTTEFINYSKNVFMYLTNHKKLIDSQSEKSKLMHRGNEFYSLSKIGPYTFADYIVAARDNSKFCASVINKTVTPWGEIKNTICVKHTIIISQRKDKKFIDEDEAYYICGILNSDIVKKYIEGSFKSNGFSLNKSNIYLPKYNKDNSLHVKICTLSKKASLESVDIDNIRKELSKLYLNLCQKKDDNEQ